MLSSVFKKYFVEIYFIEYPNKIILLGYSFKDMIRR